MYKITLNFISHVKFLRDFILDLLFPIECLQCQRQGDWLCKACLRKLKFNGKSFCLHCYSESNLGEFCITCKDKFFLNGVFIAGNYDDKIIAKLIKTFKYNFNQNLSKVLGLYLSIFLKNILNHQFFNASDIFSKLNPDKIKTEKNLPKIISDLENILLIPIPLHKKRYNWRGFNQAELLAKVIAKNFNLEMDSSNLKRIKLKIAQAKLRGKKRYENLKNNFIWQGGSLNNKNILLIDDVVTTGTTLNECARVLKNSGANEVWGLVIAKG